MLRDVDLALLHRIPNAVMRDVATLRLPGTLGILAERIADYASSHIFNRDILPLGRRKLHTCISDTNSLEEAEGSICSASAGDVAMQRRVRECQCSTAPVQDICRRPCYAGLGARVSVHYRSPVNHQSAAQRLPGAFVARVADVSICGRDPSGILVRRPHRSPPLLVRQPLHDDLPVAVRQWLCKYDATRRTACAISDLVFVWLLRALCVFPGVRQVQRADMQGQD